MQVKRETIKIDVSDKVIGRVATQIANILMGKLKPTYEPHVDGGDAVEVTGVSKLQVTGKKLNQKMYYTVSGQVGGLKEFKLKEMLEKKPERVLQIAVEHMLPKNTFRARRMKRLTFIS